MHDEPPLRDVTGTVRLDDPAAVAVAVDRTLSRCYPDGSLDRDLLHASFAFAGRLYTGRHPGYLACDMPYHDLRHALDAALAAARMVDGHCATLGAGHEVLNAELGLVAVLLALLHDTGFLRSRAEASLRGAQLAATHETRSVAVASGYLATTSCARHAGLAQLILATRVALSPEALFERRSATEVTIGHILGSADLICQAADVRYLERCYHHLYPELVLGGGDRRTTPDGREEVLFQSARDLLARTPAFHDTVMLPRLRKGLGNVMRYLEAHFRGPDPYEASMRANQDRCARIVKGDRWDLLGGPPPTTSHGLDPAFRVQ